MGFSAGLKAMLLAKVRNTGSSRNKGAGALEILLVKYWGRSHSDNRVGNGVLLGFPVVHSFQSPQLPWLSHFAKLHRPMDLRCVS